MTILEFIAKWRKVELKERSASQEHFIDLCNAFDHPTPAAADPTGESFCFEKGAAKHGGGDGFADVWKRGFFGWEYKGKHKDLTAAYDQLLRYRNALENPPLLVLCDLDRIIIHTNFTGTVSTTHEVSLDRLGDPRSIEVLRAVFHNPEALRPGRTSVSVTQDAAKRVAEIAESMRQRGLDAAEVAHFLDRIVFCQFAEDTGLLPDMVFTRIIEKSRGDPSRFSMLLSQLFESMAVGGDFGLETIRHFNGNLFEDQSALDMTADEMKRIAAAAELDWSAVDPSIFGTLFERGLDPAKRAQLGAHYTGMGDIELVVDAVIMKVLRHEWEECRSIIESLLTTGKKSPGAKLTAKPLNPAALKKAQGEAGNILHRFLVRLQDVKILDPACGSGNFLYVALLRLKDLEKEAILFGADNCLGTFLPMVGPSQLYGIEINPYAHDLAQMTVWIGWLQWIRVNGFGFPADPILKPLAKNIRLMDAIINDDGTEPEWPAVDYIVGNPPFLGGNRIRKELGSGYVDQLFATYKDRVPAFADLCCYWFEKARAHIENDKCKRAGLLATQGIRGGANREVLKRIKDSGDIFWAESDRHWILDGANVHVSMIAFDNGSEASWILDGHSVTTINPDLTSAANVTQAKTLPNNLGICFMGPSPKAPFDIDEITARTMLTSTGNPNNRPNSDVVRPVASAIDLVRGSRGCWTIDFALMTMEEAAQYEAPFEYVKRVVKPAREKRRDDYRGCWWQYARPRPEMRSSLKGLSRFIATPSVSKYRIFVWMNPEVLSNQGTLVFARSDDCFFGILHSRIHEVWARAQGTQLREEISGARYTPTTSFETFPFPKPSHAEEAAITNSSLELVAKRDEWLTGHDSKPRHLTRLYNERPTWLQLAHAKLDAAVAAAYGWPADVSDDVILERLLALNLAAAGTEREKGLE